MEETKEQYQPPEEEPQIPVETLGNKVPNSFEELNAMRQAQEEMPPEENFTKTQSTFAKNGNTILQPSRTFYNPKADPLVRYANSMNLPKDTCTVKMPKKVENAKYQIPPSEYIWNAPYLKKTQIFPSYVRNIFIIFI